MPDIRYYSTRNKNEAVSFAAAALRGLAPDGGLYVPEEVPQYSSAVKSSLGTMAFTDIAFETIRLWVASDIPGAVLEDMVNSAFPFTAPMVTLSINLFWKTKNTIPSMGNRLFLENEEMSPFAMPLNSYTETTHCSLP